MSELGDTTEPRILGMRRTCHKSINHKSELWADRLIRCLVIQVLFVFENWMSSLLLPTKSWKRRDKCKTYCLDLGLSWALWLEVNGANEVASCF